MIDHYCCKSTFKVSCIEHFKCTTITLVDMVDSSIRMHSHTITNACSHTLSQSMHSHTITHACTHTLSQTHALTHYHTRMHSHTITHACTHTLSQTHALTHYHKCMHSHTITHLHTITHACTHTSSMLSSCPCNFTTVLILRWRTARS